MLIQSRLGGFGGQWRALSRIGKVLLLSTSIFLLLGLLWGTGTVDVDYVRNRFQNTGENFGNEPIPQEKTETPIIDGVPNDQNDQPILNGIIKGGAADGTESASPSTSTSISTSTNEMESESHSTSEPHQHQDTVSNQQIKGNGKVPPKQDKEDTTTTPTTTTTSTTSSTTPTINMTEASTNTTTPETGPIASGIPIRVMFIGASMTLGTPKQSAYRQQLREWLVGLGNPVNCVGDARFGKFKDNDVQAYAAKPIEVLHEKSLKAVPEMQPNLIIVNAGSSDCFQRHKYGPKNAYDHMRKFVEFLFEASPRTTIILSTLITSPDPGNEECILDINKQIRRVVTDMLSEGGDDSGEGPRLYLSEQHYDQGLPGRVTPELVSHDKMHPTFEGWVAMGDIYKQDIRAVDAKGWIVPPVANGIMDDGDAERDLEDSEKPDNEKGDGKNGGKGSGQSDGKGPEQGQSPSDAKKESGARRAAVPGFMRRRRSTRGR